MFSYRVLLIVISSLSVGTSGRRFNRTWLPALDESVSEEQYHAKFVSPFLTWADNAIPADTVNQSFDCDAHGCPFFPNVNLLRSTGEDLQVLMDEYLNKVYRAF